MGQWSLRKWEMVQERLKTYRDAPFSKSRLYLDSYADSLEIGHSQGLHDWAQ